MRLHLNSAQKHFREEHHSQMGQLGQKVKAMQRLIYGSNDPYEYTLGGVQHVGIWMDCRSVEARTSTIILVDAGYKDRYRYMIDGIKQDGLLGKYQAAIELQKEVI